MQQSGSIRWLIVVLCVVMLTISALWLNTPPTHAQGDRIVLSGRVTSQADGAPLPGVHVAIARPDYDTFLDIAITDSSGNYTVTGAFSQQYPELIPGAFDIRFQSDTIYSAEYFDDTNDRKDADSVFLNADSPTLGINAALAEGGQVSGKVITEEDQQPLSLAEVHLYNLAGDLVASSFSSDQTGTFTFNGVPPGSYKVMASPPDSDHTHVAEYYPNDVTITEAATLEIAPGQVITDLDFSLMLGGQIAIIALSDSGSSFYAIPEVYTDDGKLFTNWRPFYYTISNLPPGHYRLRLTDEHKRHHPEFYENAESLATASPVTVNAGKVTKIYPVLAYIPHVGTIATSSGLSSTILLTLNNSVHIIQSSDSGQTWQVLPQTPWADSGNSMPPNIGVAPRSDEGSPRRILALTRDDGYLRGSTIYRSGDNGQSWANDPLSKECERGYVSDVYASPLNPTQLYILHTCLTAINGDWVVKEQILYISRDAGVTWQQQVPSSLLGLTLMDLLISPVVADRLYYRDLNYKYNWRQSNDAGATWDINIPFELANLALDAENANLLYGIAYVDGYFGQRSENDGVNWTNWAQQPCSFKGTTGRDDDNVQLMAHPTVTHVLFVRCETGLYRSDNRGDSWTQLDSNPGHLLAPDYGTPGRIFWANDNGLWASTDSGTSWTLLTADYGIEQQEPPPHPRNPVYLPAIQANTRQP